MATRTGQPSCAADFDKRGVPNVIGDGGVGLRRYEGVETPTTKCPLDMGMRNRAAEFKNCAQIGSKFVSPLDRDYVFNVEIAIRHVKMQTIQI